MELREKMIVHYAKKLGFLDDQDLSLLVQNHFPVEEYLQNRKQLSPHQLGLVRLVFVTRCLLSVAKQKQWLTQEQCDEVMHRQWEAIPHLSASQEIHPLVFANLSSQKIRKVSEKLQEQKFFTEQDRNWVKNFLTNEDKQTEENFYEKTISPSKDKEPVDSFGETIFVPQDPEIDPEVTEIDSVDSEEFPRLLAILENDEQPSAPDTAPLPKVDSYTLVKRLGNGRMGEVYLARDSQGAEVALKTLSQGSRPKFEERFLQEADVLSCLHHQNIVKMYELKYCHPRRFYYITMEYVDGKDLNYLVKKAGALRNQEAVEITLKVAKALDHAMKQNVIHRDVKPANIIIHRDGRVKLADFGLAKILDKTGITLTWEMMGTPSYMAPEQIEDSKHVDHKADIYALGATLYFMLVGNPPYADCTTLENLFHAKAQREIQLPEHCDIPPSLQDVVRKAMAIDPKNRYLTFAQFSHSLKRSNPRV